MQLVFIHGPVQAVGEVQRLSDLRLGLGVPERDDIVVGFVRGRDFHQFHGALAPVALRLDPGTRTQVVAVIQVFVAGELAAALEQAEAFRVLHAEGAHRQVLRIVQRTPQPLAVAGMDLQAAGVMQLGPEVVLLGRLVGAEQVHAGQRRQAQLADLVAEEHAGLDIHHRILARTQHEAVGAGGPRRVEQGVDHQLLVLRLRPLDPEFAEARELFARRQRGIDRQAARRQTVDLALADHAEVARAKEGGDLVLLVGLVDRIEHAETGIARSLVAFSSNFRDPKSNLVRSYLIGLTVVAVTSLIFTGVSKCMPGDRSSA